MFIAATINNSKLFRL
uniref:Uncharacterized protein n=1 Tax=Anopheles quadriannulatus TaxID=34691 RepID=A0A182XTM9_ANOQN